MALPGLLIEYLISGALSLVWLIPLLRSFDYDLLTQMPAPLIAVVLYVAGMAIDFGAFWMVSPFKRYVRASAWRKYAQPGQAEREHSIARQVRFAIHSPEVARELAMRSSRDRIARGAIVNVIALAICRLAGVVDVPVTVLIALLPLAVAMWIVFEHTSYGYEIRADYELRRKMAVSSLTPE